MFVVDTNILIYSIDSNYNEHKACRNLLYNLINEITPWYTTWGILYEFIRVTTHHKVFERPLTIKKALNFIQVLLDSPGLRVLVETDKHTELLSQTLKEVKDIRGNLIHDAHIAILMREHGLKRIYTRDMDFNLFPFLEAIDPLKS